MTSPLLLKAGKCPNDRLALLNRAIVCMHATRDFIRKIHDKNHPTVRSAHVCGVLTAWISGEAGCAAVAAVEARGDPLRVWRARVHAQGGRRHGCIPQLFLE